MKEILSRESFARQTGQVLPKVLLVNTKQGNVVKISRPQMYIIFVFRLISTPDLWTSFEMYLFP